MKIKVLLLFFLMLLGLTCHSKSYKAINIEQYKSIVGSLNPGDSVVLANGIWSGAVLEFKGNGTPQSYIYLVAETPGKVTFEGKSCLRISGNYLYVSGLKFVNGFTPKNAVIEFRTSSTDYAYHSVVSDCAIESYNQLEKGVSDHWISLYGKNNTVQYCYLAGKKNAGTTLVVWPNDSNSTNNGHLIYRNYFGFREDLGSNGGETIRIGTSQVCHLSSVTTVDGNYFEHCNGEVEVISNKSCNNTLINNTFYECEGSLVLRHGNNATVAGNWFIGNGKENTGGVRVINEGHKIYNNYFYKLAGSNFRASMVIMNAIPNSPANGYAAVKNVIIAHNTFYDCASPWAFGVGAGDRNRIVKPESTLLLNNLVFCTNAKELVKYYDQTDNIRLDNNIMINSAGSISGKGVAKGKVLKSKVNGLDMIYTTLKAKKIDFIKYDILGLLRGEAVVGAFQNLSLKPTVEMATSLNTGPAWMQKK